MPSTISTIVFLQAANHPVLPSRTIERDRYLLVRCVAPRSLWRHRLAMARTRMGICWHRRLGHHGYPLCSHRLWLVFLGFLRLPS